MTPDSTYVYIYIHVKNIWLVNDINIMYIYRSSVTMISISPKLVLLLSPVISFISPFWWFFAWLILWFSWRDTSMGCTQQGKRFVTSVLKVSKSLPCRLHTAFFLCSKKMARKATEMATQATKMEVYQDRGYRCECFMGSSESRFMAKVGAR